MYLILLVGAGFCIAGILFILRGINPQSGQSVNAVPISDLKEIKELKNQYINDPSANSTEGLKLPIDPVSPPSEPSLEQSKPQKIVEPQEDLIKEDAPLVEEAPSTELVELQSRLEAQTKEARQRIAELEKENQELSQALKAELSTKEASTLSQEDREKFEQAQKQLTRAQESVARLSKENEELKAKIETDQTDVAALRQEVDKLRAQAASALEAAQKTATQPPAEAPAGEKEKALEEKIKSLQYELTKNRAQSTGLEKICEDFKQQIEQLSKELEEAKGQKQA